MLKLDHVEVGAAGQKLALQLFSFDRMWEGYMAIYRRGAKGN